MEISGVFQSYSSWWRRLLGVACAVCEQMSLDPICSDCANRIVRLPAAICPICAAPLPAAVAPVLHDWPCARCSAHPPAFSHVCAAGLYTSPLSDLLQALKFGKRTDYAHALVRFWSDVYCDSAIRLPRADYLVPIPLHPTRHRARGFNQSALLTEGLSAAMGLPVLAHALQRVRLTPAQTQLNKRARRHNMEQVFAVTPKYQSRVYQSAIWLVDDVLTTGATAHAAARSLLQAGASWVGVLVMARTAESE